MPESQMSQLGADSFSQMKTKMRVDGSHAKNAYVRCIVDPLIRAQGDDPAKWEVKVFSEESANAFALPGKKIGVHNGMLKVAKDQDQLAAVLGHEIGHVAARHGNERVSQSLIAQGGLAAVDAAAGGGEGNGTLMAALGLGAQFGVLMPHGRKQESEADVIGLRLMAQAGFNPEGAVALWENMAKAGGGSPPEFMSTHPSHSTRIENLRSKLPEVSPTYENAKRAGKINICRI